MLTIKQRAKKQKPPWRRPKAGGGAVGRPGRWLPFKLLTLLTFVNYHDNLHSWLAAHWCQSSFRHGRPVEVHAHMMSTSRLNQPCVGEAGQEHESSRGAGFIISQRDTHLIDPTTQSSFYGLISKHTPTWRKNWNIYYGSSSLWWIKQGFARVIGSTLQGGLKISRVWKVI